MTDEPRATSTSPRKTDRQIDGRTGGRTARESDRGSDTDGALWPMLIIGALGLFILVMLARPCEVERLRAIVNNPSFGPTNTVCSPFANLGCHCRTLEGEFDRSGGQSDPFDRATVTPEVTF